MTSQKQYTPFYKATWFITVMVIFVWPIGLILMWLWAKCSRLTKILITGSLLFTIIFNLTTSFVIRPVFSSGSMMPTISLGNRGVVNHFAYTFQPPQRGDIVIFSPTRTLRSQNFKDSFTKRIIGLPGETIKVSDGQVYINEQPLVESYVAEPPKYKWGPVNIPGDNYVVLGDNRNNSYDSHHWGFVPRSYIKAKVAAIF